MRRTGSRSLVLGFAAASVVALGLPANAHPGHDGGFSAADGARDAQQHGEFSGHLPPTQSNIEVVSKLKLTNVVPEKIADVAVHGSYAYLAAWGQTTCDNNGIHVVDISNVNAPREVNFIRSKVGSYPGEGVHVVPVSTPQFTGDILVTNAETCDPHTGYGGFNLYNVTNPKKPLALFEGAGDYTLKGIQRKHANETHSAFVWDAGDKAYVVAVDNEEATDVDIFDISNPKRPALVREYNLAATFPQITQTAPDNLTDRFLHDMTVRNIAGRQIMIASYWDAGYVLLDVTDPARIVYLGDSDFATVDPELLSQAGLREKPEGNAHQAEFTHDNEYVIGSDEDFGPTGTTGSTDDGQRYTLIQGEDTRQVPAGETVTGATRYVGQACIGDPAVPLASTPNQIAVVVRGACAFTEKVTNLHAKGYIAAIVANREGADGGCGAFAMTVAGTTPTFSVDRGTGLAFFDKPYDDAACQAGSQSQFPGVALGDVGDTVSFKPYFDGWGYVHLFKNQSGKLTDLDQYAIPEAMNSTLATGFGDLSVHEVATSLVDARLAYLSYYSGGVRVARIVEDGQGGAALKETGRFIDAGGSNFWGVEVFRSASGQEYLAASDRDSGLYILKYTGP